jgi:4-coumarate--CoA ligase
VGEVLLACCNRTPEKIAQISDDNGKIFTYRDLKLATIRVCENLKKNGYQRGDIVMVIARNGHNLAPVIFGCLLLGAPVNPMDPTFGKDDLCHMIAITKPKLLFCDPGCVDLARESLVACNVPAEIITFEQKIPGLRSVDELVAEPVDDEDNYSIMPSLSPAYKQPAIIFCSSGTTGKSKAVIISQALLLSKCNELVNITENDVTLCFSSIYWLSGLIWMIYSALNNTTRVTTIESFRADLVLRIIKQYKITTIMTPPSLISSLVHYPGLASADLSSLKTYLCGGSMVSTLLLDKLQPYLPNCKIIVGYGMTELSGVIAINYPKCKAGSVGHLMGHIEAKIVNEDGAQVGPDESGEIMVRSLYYFMVRQSNFQFGTKNVFSLRSLFRVT